MKKTWIYVAIFVALLVVRFWISTFSYNNDMLNHKAWVDSIRESGFSGFYGRDLDPFAKPNYPPLITAGFFYMNSITESLNITDDKIVFAFYKIPTIFVETLAIVILLAVFGPIIAVVAAINPAIAYNTLLWGQTEGLMAGLILISLYLLNKKRLVWALVLFALSLLVKQSAIIFLPLILIIAFKNFDIKKVLLAILAMILTFVLPFIPFVGKEFFGFSFSFLLDASAGQQHQWQASVNALNFWYLAGLNLIRDSGTFLGLSYRIISIVITAALVAFIIYIFSKRKYSFENSLLAAGLINFAVCMFLTRVHERHLLPSLLLLTVVALKNSLNFALYLILSLIYFTNLYLIWHEQFSSSNQVYLKILSAINILIFFFFLHRQFTLGKETKA